MGLRETAKKWLPPLVLELARRTLVRAKFSRGLIRLPRKETTSQTFWERYNVTLHVRFRSVKESLAYLRWRNAQYFGYDQLMPVDRVSGKAILDFGCGPGHDLVGFGCSSKPARLIGMDVSRASLREAGERMRLHGIPVELIPIDESDSTLPIEDESIDVVHSSGVIHHTPDPARVLSEFRRILKPNGYAQVMVYNYDSISMHLITAFVQMVERGLFKGMSKREAFSKTTDTFDCPISRCYSPDEFMCLANDVGLKCDFVGAAVSVAEMQHLPRRFDAISDGRVDEESREFLRSLEFDRRGLPLHRGQTAGVDGCYRLTRR